MRLALLCALGGVVQMMSMLGEEDQQARFLYFTALWLAVLYVCVAVRALCTCGSQCFVSASVPLLYVWLFGLYPPPPRLPVIYVPVAVGALCPCGCQGYPSACQRFVPG